MNVDKSKYKFIKKKLVEIFIQFRIYYVLV